MSLYLVIVLVISAIVAFEYLFLVFGRNSEAVILNRDSDKLDIYLFTRDFYDYPVSGIL